MRQLKDKKYDRGCYIKMKRLSIVLIITLLTGIVGGCHYAIVESDPMRALGLTARAEGGDLFEMDALDFSFLEDEPENLTPSPSPTPTGYEEEEAPEEEPTPAPRNDETPEATKMPKVKLTPEPTPTPAPTEEPAVSLHTRDEEGENKVRKMQQRLAELGYLDVEPDGLFGSRTLKALKSFQRDKGLEETGVLDEDTRDALYPRPEVTTAPEDVLYTEGAIGRDVRVLHQRLRLFGFSDRPVIGQYVEQTTDEVMAFQSYAVKYYGTEFDDPEETVRTETLQLLDIDDGIGIPTMPVLAPEATLRPYHATDGVVSENLYNYLLSDRFPVYRETVQRGDSGDEVLRVQRRLKVLEYYYNNATGEFDTITEGALKAFQGASGLQQTGIADPETQRLLFSTAAAAAPMVDKPFYIKVSTGDQRVYVYRWVDGDYNLLVKSMICSTGVGSSTPKGVFISTGHRDKRWHYFIDFNCWAQYAFVITGNILFHSVLYSSNSEDTLRTSSVSNLGHKASHGCVRLRVEDARWIYEHCGEGQVIEVY